MVGSLLAAVEDSLPPVAVADSLQVAVAGNLQTAVAGSLLAVEVGSLLVAEEDSHQLAAGNLPVVVGCRDSPGPIAEDKLDNPEVH